MVILFIFLMYFIFDLRDAVTKPVTNPSGNPSRTRHEPVTFANKCHVAVLLLKAKQMLGRSTTLKSKWTNLKKGKTSLCT